MAKSGLKTDWQDSQYLNQKKYEMSQNDDNTVSFEDKTNYTVVGDELTADDLNTMNQYIKVSTNVNLNSTVQDVVDLESFKSSDGSEITYTQPTYHVQFKTEDDKVVSIRVDPGDILITKDGGGKRYNPFSYFKSLQNDIRYGSFQRKSNIIYGNS